MSHVLGATLVCLLLTPSTSPLHALPDLPEPQAEAWLVYDATNELLLAADNIDDRRAMASVTKLMTVLVALEHGDLDDVVRVSETAAAVGEAEIGLVPGERWTLRELLTAIMVRSGNDAAVAIAEHVGGSVAGFATLMNNKARALGMNDTSFANPHGLDAADHFTSARDLLTLALAVLDEPVIERLARTRTVLFRPDPVTGAERSATNTNRLLGAYPGVDGLKTGYTSDAGLVLVTSADHGNRTFVTVVMGSDDHFADTRILLDFAYATFGPADRWIAPLVESEAMSRIPLAPAERRRLAEIPELPSGADVTSDPLGTPWADTIAGWLSDRLPGVLGGDS